MDKMEYQDAMVVMPTNRTRRGFEIWPVDDSHQRLFAVNFLYSPPGPGLVQDRTRIVAQGLYADSGLATMAGNKWTGRLTYHQHPEVADLDRAEKDGTLSEDCTTISLLGAYDLPIPRRFWVG